MIPLHPHQGLLVAYGVQSTLQTHQRNDFRIETTYDLLKTRAPEGSYVNHIDDDDLLGGLRGGRARYPRKCFRPAAADTDSSKVSPAFNEPQDGAAARLDDRDRFAGQCRLVDRCRARCDDAVNRNDFPCPHQKLIANGDS